MLTTCKYCGRIHKVGEACSMKPKKDWSRYKGDKELRAFRSSSQWTEKSIAVKERDKYLCRVCLKNHILNMKRLEVHHITPLIVDFDKRLDDDNLITLCRTHHEQAENGELTARELRELAEESIHENDI